MKRTLIIAEAGVNHNGSYDLAEEMIDRANYVFPNMPKRQIIKRRRPDRQEASWKWYRN